MTSPLESATAFYVFIHRTLKTRPEEKEEGKEVISLVNVSNVGLSEMFLSFYKELIDAQCFLFYICLMNYART